MSDEVNKPVPRWMLVSFLAYFAAILPAMAWGLWSLISTNTFGLPVSIPEEIVALKLTPQQLADYVSANQESRLVLTQGQLFLAAMLAGGIGSYIHGVNSFVTYVGNRSFTRSWAPWYLLRPFMGVAMAVIFYVVVRGGVLVLSGGVSQVDPYAMMTVAALAGMFSKQASDKLAEVFDTLFRSRADEERSGKLQGAEFKVTALDPAKVQAGSADTMVKVSGSGFVEGAVARVGGTDLATTFKSATELTVLVPAANLAAAGEVEIEIVNPGENGGSGKIKLIVELAPVPAGDGGAGGAGPDGALQLDRVVTDNADGSINVVSEATVTITPGATDTSTAASETTDPTSAAGDGATSGASGTTGEGAGGSSAMGDITAESLAGSAAGTGDAADETTPKL